MASKQHDSQPLPATDTQNVLLAFLAHCEPGILDPAVGTGESLDVMRVRYTVWKTPFSSQARNHGCRTLRLFGTGALKIDSIGQLGRLHRKQIENEPVLLLDKSVAIRVPLASMGNCVLVRTVKGGFG
ncbi:hypothetical protein TrVFT333_010811 [Trichoderma virens FT-333]|nr:hypothetical protein TrVFT333_010811 [Trichoderma virens FT-333]